MLESQRAELAGEYRTLSELSQAITYAESPSFLYGSLFNEKVHTALEVVETKGLDKKDEPKPKKHNKKRDDVNVDPDL